MKLADKRSFAVLLTMLLIGMLLLPAAAMAQDSLSGQTVAANNAVAAAVYGGSGSTVGGSVYGGSSVGGSVYGGGGSTVGDNVYGGGACKALSASGPEEWMKLLNSSISPGKVTFTIPDGYCSTEISFTSYSYPVGVTPEPSGKPYEKAAVYSNVTASYGPGTHTVQTDLPCGYWLLELYKGSVTAQLNTENGHAADQQIARLVNSVVNSCSSSSDSSDSSSDSGSSGSGSSSGGSGAGTIADPVVIESFDFLDAKALCTEKDGVYRFQLTNRNSSDLTISYSLAGQKVWTETVLPAGGTKTIEIVSDQAAPLQLTVNGTTKTVARAAADKCSSSGGSTGGGTGTGTGTGTNGTGGTPNGSGGTPNGLENLGNSPVPTGPAQLPAPSASGNGQGTAGTDSGNGAQDNGPIPLGYSSLPQTGESFPWGYYAAGALMVCAGLFFGLKPRRNG